MRIILAMAVVTVMFAGCLAGDEPVNTNSNAAANAVAGDGSHEAYGFLVNGDLAVAPQAGLIKDRADDGTLHWYKPTYRDLPAAPSTMTRLAEVEGVSTAGGIAIFGSLGFIGGRSSGPLYVVDLSNPEEPKVIGEAPDVPVRDADTMLFPDGRLVVITTAGGRNMFATDVTDPTKPKLIGNFETTHGNHNIAVVPGTPIVYNSGGSGKIDIVDWSNPERPVEVGQFGNGNGCHDISFFINASRDFFRAYCAGYGQWEVWDITDPKAPIMVHEQDYPSVQHGIPVVGDVLEDAPETVAFPGSFSHLAMVNHNASIMILGDEHGGGGTNSCDFYLEGSEGQTYSGPIGNLWFYDITDETNPVLHGHVSPTATDAHDGSCTAHFGRLIEDTGMLVMGFYAAGVVLVDFNDLDNPRIVDRYDPAGDIWDVWFHQGYLMTGDMVRGMDVLGFE